MLQLTFSLKMSIPYPVMVRAAEKSVLWLQAMAIWGLGEAYSPFYPSVKPTSPLICICVSMGRINDPFLL